MQTVTTGCYDVGELSAGLTPELAKCTLTSDGFRNAREI
jgi:hypothetical protein